MENIQQNNNGGWKTSVDVFRGTVRTKLEAIEGQLTRSEARINGRINNLEESIETVLSGCAECSGNVKKSVDEINLGIKQKEAVNKYKKRLATALWGIFGGSLIWLLKSIFPKLLNF